MKILKSQGIDEFNKPKKENKSNERQTKNLVIFES